jgi:hypothetical protein
MNWGLDSSHRDTSVASRRDSASGAPWARRVGRESVSDRLGTLDAFRRNSLSVRAAGCLGFERMRSAAPSASTSTTPTASSRFTSTDTALGVRPARTEDFTGRRLSVQRGSSNTLARACMGLHIVTISAHFPGIRRPEVQILWGAPDGEGPAGAWLAGLFLLVLPGIRIEISKAGVGTSTVDALACLAAISNCVDVQPVLDHPGWAGPGQPWTRPRSSNATLATKRRFLLGGRDSASDARAAPNLAPAGFRDTPALALQRLPSWSRGPSSRCGGAEGARKRSTSWVILSLRPKWSGIRRQGSIMRRRWRRKSSWQCVFHRAGCGHATYWDLALRQEHELRRHRGRQSWT